MPQTNDRVRNVQLINVDAVQAQSLQASLNALRRCEGVASGSTDSEPGRFQPLVQYDQVPG